MRRTTLFFMLGLIAFSLIVTLILLMVAFTPENTNPAFATAVAFVNAAGTGDDDAAFALLGPALRSWVADYCPDGRLLACIQPYTPPEWGAFRSVVFRRATPDGPQAWDVDLIATYDKGKGFSGVCIYNRVEQAADDSWQVVEWAGFIHCGDSASRNMANNPDAPNRAP